MALDGQLASVYGYSFILTDIPHQPTAWVEHFHRHRAQIEERLKDTKTGQGAFASRRRFRSPPRPRYRTRRGIAYRFA